MTFKSRCVFRGDGTCSARFLHSYSFHLYAFIFIKGILLLSILCFNSLSHLLLKIRHSRRVFFTRRSSPVFMIKKSCVGKCRCKIFVFLIRKSYTAVLPTIFTVQDFLIRFSAMIARFTTHNDLIRYRTPDAKADEYPSKKRCAMCYYKNS